MEYVKKGMLERALKGYKNGGAVLGYNSEKGNLVVNEEEADTIKMIFSTFNSGENLTHTANYINSLGCTTKRGKQFTPTAIRDILRNPLYVGLIRFNQFEDWNVKGRLGRNEDYIEVNGLHAPIISETMWRTAQHRLMYIGNGRDWRL